MEIIKKDVHGWEIERSMMKVEDDCIFVAKKIIVGEFFMMNEMTSKDKTLCKIKEMSIALLIVHDVLELFICVECALNECEQMFVIVKVWVIDSLNELIVVCVEDERCSKSEMFDDDEMESMMKSCDGESVMWMEMEEKRHVVDGGEWFVGMESHSFVDPNASLCEGWKSYGENIHC